MSRAKRLLTVSLALLASTLLAGSASDVNQLPKPTGYVSDLAHIVDPAEKEQLEIYCTKVEQQLGVQFALVTIDSIGDQPIRDFALSVFRKWGVGSAKDNQGVLLLLAVKERQNDIETGRGIEPYITDGFAGSTLRAMRPELRSGNYGQALTKAARAMAGQIAQGKNIVFSDADVPEVQPERQSRGNDVPWGLLIFGIFFLVWLFGRGGRRGGGGRYGGRGGGSGIGNVLTGMLIGNMLGGGRRDDWSGGWGGGGGFGGGSGGGGGFGGFGGGDAGGGGASSNW